MTVDTSLRSDHLETTPFGQLLRSLRTRALLSQEQLAQRSGLGVRTIRDLEGGRVSYPHGKSIRLLAGALGLVGEAKQVFELTSRAAELPPLADWEGETPFLSTPPADHPSAPDVAGHSVWAARTPRTSGGVNSARQPASSEWAMPAHLPMDTPVFAGRTGELAQLDALLERVDNGPAVVIAAIWGGPGVGKTTLAVHWAHRVGDHFPDGQLYVDLRDFDQHGPLSSSQVICSVLSVLGVPSEQVPADLPGQACLYRSLLHRRRVLVLLDNARDAEQVRPLLPGTPGSLVVVTSRQQLIGLIAVEGATPVPVDLLTKTEARELMARRLGTERVLAESAAVDEIIDRCARLPLAMATFASRAATSPNLSLAALAAELRDAPGALDAFGGASSEVATSFALSYNALSADAARLFRLFGGSQDVELSTATAALVGDIPEPQVRPAFDELLRAHLIVERRPGCFGTHRLLRAYAAELAGPHTLGESACDEAERKQNTGRTTAIRAINPPLVVRRASGLL